MALNLIIEFISAFLTDSAVLIAFIQFRKIEIDRKKQIIKSIYNQLETTGVWAQVNSPGYIGHPNDKEKIEWAHPFSYVYGIKHEGLQLIALQEGIIDLPDRFISRLFEYNQNISRIKDLADFKKDITSSNFKAAYELEKQIKNYSSKINSVSINWNSFLVTIRSSVGGKNYPEIVRMAELFADYGTKIHYEIIGNSLSNGMKQQHEELKIFISQIEKKLCRPSFFNIIFLSTLSLILFFLFLVFFFNSKLFYSYLYLILISNILIAVLIELFYIRSFEIDCIRHDY